jgi:hypothetical protein
MDGQKAPLSGRNWANNSCLGRLGKYPLTIPA